jgi:hypothetical protein
MVVEVELTLTENINPTEPCIYVTVGIFRHHSGPRIRRRTLVAPMSIPLKQALERWQQAFRSLVDPFLMEEGEEGNDGEVVCNCWQSYSQLRDELDRWLSEDGWQKVRQWLRENIERSQLEIHLIIQTENPLLQQLPWQDGLFLPKDYPPTEIVLSSSEYEVPRYWQGVKTHPKVRILVILGADDNLDLQLDEKLFRELKYYGAEVHFLKQRSLENLIEALQEAKGWHLLFYAGHSETLANNSGLLWLNKEEPPIPIGELTSAFEVAIENGLHLGMFNSCNGLGIANDLTLLQFPQVIVMRELVPNAIAVKFLEYFLFNYCRNRSLIFSLHQAKKKLFDEYHHQDYYPGVHNLPILYSNPALPIPQWQDFLKPSHFSTRTLVLYGVLAVLSLSLPFSLMIEYRSLDDLLFYAKIYPHVISFPVIFIWGFVWCLFKAFHQWVNKKKIVFSSLIILVISLLIVQVELTAPNMLLFELNGQATTTVSNLSRESIDRFMQAPDALIRPDRILPNHTFQFSQPDLKNSLKHFVTHREQLTPADKSAYYEYMKLGLDYSKTWSLSLRWQSISRFCYGVIVGVVSFSILMLFFFWMQLVKPKKINNYINYLGYLSFAQLIIFLWMPFRLYYMLSIKPLIFGEGTQISNLDLVVYMTVGGLLFVTISLLFRLRQYAIAFWTLIGVFLIILLSIQPLNTLIDYSFGLHTVNEVTWIFYPILMFVILFTWSQILENWHS